MFQREEDRRTNGDRRTVAKALADDDDRRVLRSRPGRRIAERRAEGISLRSARP